MKWGILLAIASVFFLGSTTLVLSQDNAAKNCKDMGVLSLFSKFLDVDNKVFSERSVNEFCNEFDQLVRSVRDLRDELKEMKSKLPPPDSILIIDDESGCPDGWTNVAAKDPEVFEGRVPVVAALPGQSGKLQYRMTGGATQHTLGVAELPSHDHETVIHAGMHDPVGWDKSHVDKNDVEKTFAIKFSSRVDSPTLVFKTRIEGLGNAFDIMPPYVPLHFCKLD